MNCFNVKIFFSIIICRFFSVANQVTIPCEDGKTYFNGNCETDCVCDVRPDQISYRNGKPGDNGLCALATDCQLEAYSNNSGCEAKCLSYFVQPTFTHGAKNPECSENWLYAYDFLSNRICDANVNVFLHRQVEGENNCTDNDLLQMSNCRNVFEKYFGYNVVAEGSSDASTEPYGCFYRENINNEKYPRINYEQGKMCAQDQTCICTNQCPAGKFGTYEKVDCQDCEAGQYSSAAGTKDKCTSCPDGYSSNAAATSCTACAAGS